MAPARRRLSKTAVERRFHQIALRALALTVSDRSEVVERMFAQRRRDTVSYWLQLLLSMAIATVGLVLGSTAVVIGAMLISPLMGPIVELGMGLVVGSPILTIRSFARMTGSVAAVVGGAALLTTLLPFQEVTAEIATRTSPTALDLLLAVFVAIAAAFTTARPGSDTTSAAAGTAISIALVPPVCVIGFGVGVLDWVIARGATLLFLTNLTAILVVSVLFFWALGFERVRSEGWEEAALEGSPQSGIARRAVDALRGLFGSRYSRVVRVGLPVLLVAAVFFPLSQALEQVAWEVRARSAVSQILAEALESRRAVRSEVSVARGAITTHLYLVGSADDASMLEREITTRVAARTGVVPSVRIVAVPDVSALRAAIGSSDDEPGAAPAIDLAGLRQRLGSALHGGWPGSQLGPLLAWRLELPDSAAPVVVVDHLGEPLGPAGDALLARAIADRIGVTLTVRTRAFPAAPATAAADSAAEWLPTLLGAVETVGRVDRLFLCVSLPPVAPAVRGRVREAVAGAPAGRVAIDSTGERWSARYSATPCPAPDSAAAPQAP